MLGKVQQVAAAVIGFIRLCAADDAYRALAELIKALRRSLGQKYPNVAALCQTSL